MIAKREVYLQMLIERMNNGAIKVITGFFQRENAYKSGQIRVFSLIFDLFSL